MLPLYAGLITLGTAYFSTYVAYIFDLARAFATALELHGEKTIL